jgi:ribosomal protein L12E/L44/L45/RPP1/RPP2
MSDQIKSQVISRRKALFLVGLAASLAVPATVITASDADAQQTDEQSKKKKGKKKEKGEKKEQKEEEKEERKY